MERQLLLDIEADNAALAASVVAATRTAAKWLAAETFSEPVERVCHAMIRDGIRYDAEHGTQYVRMPWRLIEDGVGDCKSYAVFIGAVCRARGCGVVLRFVRQHGQSHFSHVYAVVDGVPVDPLLPFGEECKYDSCEDVRI